MRKILVVTGTRAEYGILRPVIKAINDHSRLKLLLLVTGMHLSYEFGFSVKEIEEDGFRIDHKVDMLLSGDSKESMVGSLAIGIMKIAQVIDIAKPDIVFVCGDRSEPLAATLAAAYLKIPVAHLWGGDAARASNIDDSIRFAITKFAHIHFTATRTHKQRIIKLGEEPWRVHFVGSPAIDSILQYQKNSVSTIAKRFDFELNKPIILVVQHPTTITSENADYEIRQTLEAIVELKKQTILIYPNADAGGRRMIEVIKEYEKYPFIKIFKNLPHKDFLGLMKTVRVMVGNSSSGIFEAPSFQLPVVNVGIRQSGRERAKNVIDVDYNKNQIVRAIKKALYDKEFQEKVAKCKNPYGNGKASQRIVKILSRITVDEKLLRKQITY